VESQIGPYRIIDQIAEGARGPTFAAVDPASNRRVILKCLKAPVDRSDIFARLHSESLARLNHPNIARLFGFVCRDEDIYLVMEFVEGEALESLLREQGRFDPIVALGLLHQMISAVGFAHDLGMIHGNLRSSNVVVTGVGAAKILDFPVCHVLGNSAPPGAHTAPEQLKGDPLGERSDIYALGLLFYEMIVGRGPFDLYGRDNSAARRGHVPAPPSVFVPNIPRWLDAFVLRALAAAPADRYPSAKAMARAMKLPIASVPSSARVKSRGTWRQRSARGVRRATEPVSRAGNRCLESAKRVLATVAGAPGRGTRSAARCSHRLAGLVKASARRGFHRARLRGGALLAACDRLRVVENGRITAWAKLPDVPLKLSWARYGSVLGLIVLASGEVFYFRGAHISLLLDAMASGPSVNDSVDAMFARLRQEESSTERTGIKKGGTPPFVEPKAGRSRPIERRNRANAVGAREVVKELPRTTRGKGDAVASRLAKQPRMAAVEASEVKERNSGEPAGTVRNNPPRLQLNVQWEN
jgi:hypothetical protein